MPGLGEKGHALELQKGTRTMGKVLEVSEETYQQFTALAEQQHRTPEEMLRLCLLASPSVDGCAAVALRLALRPRPRAGSQPRSARRR